MSGPPKTPTHLRLVRGNPSKRPINKNEPQPPKGVPPVPKHFDKQGKYWFKRMAEELDAIGVISQLDGEPLSCLWKRIPNTDITATRWRLRDIRTELETQTGDVMIKAHPAAIMKADAWKRLRAMLGEFGMTPASRSKVVQKLRAKLILLLNL